jgi:hypothetical protein
VAYIAFHWAAVNGTVTARGTAELVAIVIALDALVTPIPVPAVIVAAAGLPDVLPTTIWPFVKGIQVGTPEESVVKPDRTTDTKLEILLAVFPKRIAF